MFFASSPKANKYKKSIVILFWVYWKYSISILLASLQFIDAIVLFSENTPKKIIETIIPDVLAKGGDYNLEEIVGYDVVTKNGGKVVQVPFIDGYSTSIIINKIKQD